MTAVAAGPAPTPEFLKQQTDDAFALWTKICMANVLYDGAVEKQAASAGLTPAETDLVAGLVAPGVKSAWRRPGPKGPTGDIIVSLHSPPSCSVTAIKADARYASEKFLQEMKEQEASGVAVKKMDEREGALGDGNTRRMIVYLSAPAGSDIGLMWTVIYTESDKLLQLILEAAVVRPPTETPASK